MFEGGETLNAWWVEVRWCRGVVCELWRQVGGGGDGTKPPWYNIMGCGLFVFLGQRDGLDLVCVIVGLY